MRCKCKTKTAIYICNVTLEGNVYISNGEASLIFNRNLANHLSSFKNNGKGFQTNLCNLIWFIKDRNKGYMINWQLSCTAKPFRPGTKKCDLC